MESINLYKKISEFIKEFPLYKKWNLDEFKNGDLRGDNPFENVKFTFYCENEKSNQTFVLRANPINRSAPTSGILQEKDNINWKGENESFQGYIGKCQGCENFFLMFQFRFVRKDKQSFVQKVGQFPPFRIDIDKELLAFLDEKNRNLYEKGLMNLSQSYGIGSFAYFRRLIENEIDSLIDEISKIKSEHQEKILEAIKKNQATKQKSILIDELFKYLPASLKPLGDNPIRLLYDQLSIGIHSLSDDECIDRSINIDTILKFVITEINKEKNYSDRVKEAMKKLKN